MNIEKIRDYCLKKKGVTESFPFDETTLVFKVMGKMFALVALDKDPNINLKCDPRKSHRAPGALSICIARLSHEQASVEYHPD